MSFGAYIKGLREAKRATDPAFSLRQVANRIGVEPSYLSKLEQDANVPSEKVVKALAEALGANYDILWALTGRVSPAFQKALIKRPELFVRLLADLQDAPDTDLIRISQAVRDGNW